MPDFYLQEGQRFEAAGANTGISEGTEITAAGSTNTKGSYTQLLASTAFASAGILITQGGNSNNSANFLTDIAIGGSGSEQVVVPNLFYKGNGDGRLVSTYLPCSVPSGQRISARTQCSSATGKLRIMCQFIAGGFQMPPGVSQVTAYGADLANSRGTDFTSSGSSNTKGSWTALSTSTTAPMSWAAILAVASSGSQHLFDIGVGGAGSEVAVVTNLNIRAGDDDIRAYAFPLRIPKASRLSVRCAAAAGSQTMRLVLYGAG
jgi:hypothetical protein